MWPIARERIMKMDWDVDDEGVMELPVLKGFSVAMLPHAMLAVLLRCAPGDVPGDRNFQIGMNAESARELAAGLLQAAKLMADIPKIGRLN
jgi:hypothetical protein